MVIANPWKALPRRPPFVVTSDAPYIEAFNQRFAAKKSHRIDTRLLPEPFVGRPDAPVLLLALNPGWSPKDLRWNRRSSFRHRVRSCLSHAAATWPFYHLDPSEKGPGARWWRRNLGRLVKDSSSEAVAQHVLCVEYFPYHSDEFHHGTLRLPSQSYTFELVRSAIHRRALIVLVRGGDHWLGAVPELERYHRLFRTRNPRTAAISPRNCPEAYARILRRVRAPDA